MFNIRLIHIALVGAIAVPSLSSAQDPQTTASRMMLALVDHESAYQIIVAKCEEKFPSDTPTLKAAISKWVSKNSEPLRELRLMYWNSLVVRGAPISDADAQVAKFSGALTSNFSAQFANVSASDLNKACTGAFATTLDSPELDFQGFLASLKTRK